MKVDIEHSVLLNVSNEIKDFDFSSSYHLVLSGQLTKCEIRRFESIKILKESGPLAISYIPRCELNGSFSLVQCWGDVVVCWCVDDEGQIISGTRTKGTPQCKRGEILLPLLTDVNLRKIFYFQAVSLQASFNLCPNGLQPTS